MDMSTVFEHNHKQIHIYRSNWIKIHGTDVKNESEAHFFYQLNN